MKRSIFLLILLVFVAASSFAQGGSRISTTRPQVMHLRVPQMDNATVTVPDYNVTVKLKDRKGAFTKDGVKYTVELDERFSGMPFGKNSEGKDEDDLFGILRVSGEKPPSALYLILFHALDKKKIEQSDFFFLVGSEVKQFRCFKPGASTEYLELRGTKKYKVIVEMIERNLDPPGVAEYEIKPTVSNHHFMEKE